MRICTDHWAIIRAGLRNRGLLPASIDPNPKTAGTPAAAVVNVNYSIFLAFLGVAPRAWLLGDQCPLCQTDRSEAWIEDACEAEYVRSRLQ